MRGLDFNEEEVSIEDVEADLQADHRGQFQDEVVSMEDGRIRGDEDRFEFGAGGPMEEQGSLGEDHTYAGMGMLEGEQYHE